MLLLKPKSSTILVPRGHFQILTAPLLAPGGPSDLSSDGSLVTGRGEEKGGTVWVGSGEPRILRQSFPLASIYSQLPTSGVWSEGPLSLIWDRENKTE